jgi:hypothetical protein
MASILNLHSIVAMELEVQAKNKQGATLAEKKALYLLYSLKYI